MVYGEKVDEDSLQTREYAQGGYHTLAFGQEKTRRAGFIDRFF
jgi:hypothetical protein